MNKSRNNEHADHVGEMRIDYSDIPALNDSFWENAVIEQPNKISVTIRLDEDLIEFFRKSGPGYQTRINRILRHYMIHSSMK